MRQFRLKAWIESLLVILRHLCRGQTPAESKGKANAIQLRRKELLVRSALGKCTFARSFYTKPKGFEVLARWDSQAISDVPDAFQQSFSQDNGRTWAEWKPVPVTEKTQGGIYYHGYGMGWPDPITGRLLSIDLDAVMPGEVSDAGEFDYQRFLNYRVSLDGEHTDIVRERVIQQGQYNVEHPTEGVWLGKNSFATGMNIVYSTEGRIICPITIAPLGPDGKLYNPGGGFSYDHAAVLIGKWNKDATINWDRSELIAADPARTTRGWPEPTIAQMPGGRILMVMRGSNLRGKEVAKLPPAAEGQASREMPGYKWYAVSEDGGYHWSPVKPWIYSDGQSFFSPSSCSQLITHSKGQIYWIGNIVAENPKGNSPRYPLVVGRVDPKSLLLVRESIAVIDSWTPQDDPLLQLSNFWAREDRENGDIVLHLTRFVEFPQWQGDAMIYHIQLSSSVR